MQKIEYPDTRTIEQVDTYHGVKVSDPYRWLEDVDATETHAWVAAQNKVTQDFLAGVGARQMFKDRLTELWDYERFGIPTKEGGRTFYSRNDGLQNQSVYYVQDTDNSEPRVLLDPNTLSDDATISFASKCISKDGKYMAWSTSVSGSDWRTWYIRDIATATDLPDKVEWSKFSGASWAPDGSGFYYSRYDSPTEGQTFEEANFNQKLYFHKVGTNQSEDLLVYERPDKPKWGFQGTVTEDSRFLIIEVWQGSADMNRVFYKDLQADDGEMHELLNEFDAQYDFIGNKGSIFYFKTNRNAPRNKVVAIDTNRPDPEYWCTLIPESDDTISSVSLLDHSFVVKSMHDVANVVKVYNFDGTLRNSIDLPGLGSVGGFHGHATDTESYYSFNSFLNPSEIYHYDFKTRKSSVFRAPAIKFDFSNYETTQIFYPSKDGTKVPMFLVHKKGLKLDGTAPTILYGYGGFNVSMKPRFRISVLPWLENGGVYAVANIRGGGEYGQQWHEAGSLKNKQNTFDDFIAAAEYLIVNKYTSCNRLAINGGSNGGTLVGAVVNQRPELFGAAIPAVGVMDMLRFQLFTIGWAWTSDYGSSDDPELFPVLQSYSPYHNLKPGVEYPSIMVTTADHDDRVVPGHSFKYAAMLQACQGGNLPTLIRIQTKAGHGAGMPTDMVIAELADRYAFLYKALGVE